MGYYITVQDQHIIIKQRNFTAANEALKSLELGGWCQEPEKDNLLLRLEGWRWEPRVLEKKDPKVKSAEPGDIIYLAFLGEKIDDEEKMFQALAPFIEPGGFVEISGEEDARWRWVFPGGGRMLETNVVMDWDDKCEAFDALLKHKDILPTLMNIHPALDAAIERVLRGKRKQ